ncbi:MAG: SdrD B-like domain-containing protein, partial [Acidimicrobiales bacterium]
SHLDGIDSAGTSAGDDAAVNDEISAIVLAPGVNATGYDFAELGQSSIAGTVVDDAGNGIANTTITLTGTDDLGAAVSLTTTTDGNGDYSFTDLRPGTYTVDESQPTGYGDGGEDAGSLGGTVTDDQIADIALPAFTDSIDNDFDETRGSIAGTVFHDLNDDGLQDGGEPGISGVTVTLTGTDDLGNAVSLTTTTDVDGNYGFDDLISGTYIVNETQPVPYNDGIDTAGTSAGDDAAVNDEISAIVLAPGVNATGYDFGEVGTVLTGMVWLDTNGDGVIDAEEANRLGGVVITLLDAAGDVVATTTTDVDGSYAFGQLVAGDYTIVQGQPDLYGTTTPNSLAVSVPVGGLTDNDFGEQGGLIEGRVWDDDTVTAAEGDGIDNNEPGMDGLTVELRDEDGNVIGTTTTASDGTYAFVDLPAGNYLVAILPPAGETLSPQNAGAADDVDSDADLLTKTIAVVLGAGESVADVDAGVQEENVDLEVDLILDKTSVKIGDTVTYTATGANTGNAPVVGSLMTINLPAGVSYVSAVGAGWVCTPSGQTVSCEYAEALMPGEVAPPVAVEAKVAAAGTLNATASIQPLVAGITEARLSNNDDQVPLTVSAAATNNGIPSTLAFTGASTLLLLLLGGVFIATGSAANLSVRRRRS